MEIKCIKIENMTDSVCEPSMRVKYLLQNETANYTKRREPIVLETEVIKPSENRTKIICPKFYSCGGCDFLHVKYKQQAIIKKTYLIELINQYRLNVNINDVVLADQNLNYRHKAILSATTFKNQLKLGLYKKGSKEIFPFLDCYLHEKETNLVFKLIEEQMNLYKIKAYHYEKNEGLLKHVQIRKSYTSNEMLITFVTNGDVLPHAKQMIRKIREVFPKATSFVQNVHYKKTHLVLVEKDKILYGPGYITDEILGIKYRLSSQSFYQVNPLQMVKLYDFALNLAEIKKTDFVVDTYSGIGTISLLATKYSNRVLSIESNKSAHLDAIQNAKLNQIQNIQMIHDDVSSFIDQITEKVDVLIMDPPREGATEIFIHKVLKLSPRKIIYISCGPESLMRDLKLFKEKYQFNQIYPFDMFPQTAHVESITLLSLK
jgi:23S rRNA (uracil1939-C5)-methyltransferase